MTPTAASLALEAVRNFPGGPALLWILLGGPLLLVGVLWIWMAVRSTLPGRRVRRPRNREQLERDAAAEAMNDMQSSQDNEPR